MTRGFNALGDRYKILTILKRPDLEEICGSFDAGFHLNMTSLAAMRDTIAVCWNRPGVADMVFEKVRRVVE